MRIAHISDLHLNDQLSKHFEVDSEANFKCILDNLTKQQIDFVVFTGDYGTKTGLNILQNSVKNYLYPSYFCLGNHDKAQDLIDIGLVHNNKDFQCKLKFENITIILLDTSPGFITKEQGKWLSENLDDGEVNLVFTHYPLLATKNKQMDEELGIKDNAIILDSLQKRNSKVYVLSGHYHRLEVTVLKDITQIICPSALMQIKEASNEIRTESFKFGYNILEIVKEDIKLETIYFQGYGKDKQWERNDLTIASSR